MHSDTDLMLPSRQFKQSCATHRGIGPESSLSSKSTYVIKCIFHDPSIKAHVYDRLTQRPEKRIYYAPMSIRQLTNASI